MLRHTCAVLHRAVFAVLYYRSLSDGPPKGGIFMGRMFPDIEGTGAVYCSLGISHLFSTKTWLRHVSCSVLGGVLVCVLAVCWRRVCVLTVCWRRVGDFGNMLETDEKREDDSEEKRRGKRRL